MEKKIKVRWIGRLGYGVFLPCIVGVPIVEYHLGDYHWIAGLLGGLGFLGLFTGLGCYYWIFCKEWKEKEGGK